ncbi:MAG: hypothetical protein RhofKO_07000 [Rhodothermales bacterium]
MGVGLFVFTQAPCLAHSNESDTLHVGTALPKADLITPRTEQFILYMLRDGQRQPTTLLTRTISTSPDGTLGIVQHYESASGVNTDSSVVQAGTLAPLTYRARQRTQYEAFDFTATNVIGRITPNEGDGQTVDLVLDAPVYNAVLLDELIQALPLNLNYVGRFKAYNPGRTIMEMTLSVTGSALLPLANGQTMDTWTVRLEGGPVVTELWIAKQTQQNIKQKAVLPNGGEFWRVRTYDSATH